MVVKAEEMHLIGAVSIFLSSKYEDVLPIFLSKLVKTVANNKFTKEQVL